MIKSDTETNIFCPTCQKNGIMREVVLIENGMARKISYATHHESIIDPEHIAALHRAEAFYKEVFALIDEFKQLPAETKIIRIENAAGRLVELDIGSERPSACTVRKYIIPYFTLKTFGKEFEIKLESRELQGTTLEQLLNEVTERAMPIIEETRDRSTLGLN